ncbi:hypothetical protein [Haliangium sp.]|uniref:hypothetical protein n=1 Tax=Haliangium sp. TaxID=2663208 RepID=UPI003D0ED3D9
MAKLKTEELLDGYEHGHEPSLRDALTAIVADLKSLHQVVANQGLDLSKQIEDTTRRVGTVLELSGKRKPSKKRIKDGAIVLRQRSIRKQIEDSQQALRELFTAVQSTISRSIDTDKLAKAEIDAAWSYLKAVLDIAIITTASALGGPAAGLIASGILKASPTQLASGIFSNTVIGPTELQGTDGGSYYSLDVIPKGMSASENALFRIHSSVDQVGSLLAGALGTDVDNEVSVELPEALGNALAATQKVSEILRRAAKQGEYLMATYVAAHLTVPNLYDPLFKYFYISKLLGKEDLAGFVGKTSTLTSRYKETKSKVLKARLSGGKYTVVDATFGAYPSSYNPHQVATLRAHMAGYIKHIEAVHQRTILLSRSVTDGLTRSSKTDLLHRTEAGSNLLKSYFRQKKVWDDLPRGLAPLVATMRRPFAEHESIFDTRSNPLRVSKHVERRKSETSRGMDRKRLLLSWFIVHRVFELHVGHPIPALMPPATETQLEAFAEAVAEILDLCTLLSSLYGHDEPLESGTEGQVRNHLLFCALVVTPTVLDLTKFELKKGTVGDLISKRFQARAVASARLSFERGYLPDPWQRARRRAFLSQFEHFATKYGRKPVETRAFRRRTEPFKKKIKPKPKPKPKRSVLTVPRRSKRLVPTYKVGDKVRIDYHLHFDVVGEVTKVANGLVTIRVIHCYESGTTIKSTHRDTREVMNDVMSFKPEQFLGHEPS